MNKFKDLYEFIDVAKVNRKYASNTANGLKSALKIFEKELNIDEINSVGLVEDNLEEIFINVVGSNKDKNIGSLNTYKARVLKIIKDYQKYGIDPSKMQGWNTKIHKTYFIKSSKKDTQDGHQDRSKITLSDPINTPVENVHKIELQLRDHAKSIIIIPSDINPREAEMIKAIIDSLTI
jgi:hypothetical protein